MDADFSRLYNNKISILKTVKYIFTSDMTYSRWKYMKYMRICDYFKYDTNIFHIFIKMFYQRKKNKLGILLGYEINSLNISEGLLLYHNGPIVINGNSKIGKFCCFHGDNCVGDNGMDDLCPIIGDYVDVGVGAKIIGNVKIASNVKIGAGAVVVNDILEEGVTVVGVPGRIVR